jgi:hypothetical protein
MSSGLAGIDCRPVDDEDYPSTFVITPGDLVKVLGWLLRLP